jgi:alkylhydroperoxidase family enzyme
VRQAVPADDSKRAAYQALEDRVRTGPGTAPSELRDRAFRNAGLDAPLDGLLGAVATQPGKVSDLEFAAARAAGYSEDQLFELVICAAVGQAGRQYDAGLAALADAVAAEEDRRAP